MIAYAAPVNPAGATTVTINQQPVDTIGYENGKATFTIAATGANPSSVVYQWQRYDTTATEWTNIVGATSASYVTPVLVQAGDDGSKFRCVVSNPGGSLAQKVSAVATLTVDLDTVPPTVELISGLPVSNEVLITFSEPMLLADNAANYSLTDSNNNTYIPSSVISLPDGASYILVFDSVGFQASQTYTVASSDVYDRAFNPVQVNGTFVGWYSQGGVVQNRVYFGNASMIFNTFTQAVANFPMKPDIIEYLNSVDTPVNRADAYMTAIRGYFIPPETADYRFRVVADDSAIMYLSTGPEYSSGLYSTNKAQLFDIEGSCAACGDGHYAPLVSLTANVPYYFELYLLEGGGGDYIHLSFTNNGPSGVYGTWGGTADVNLGNITSGFIAYGIPPDEAVIAQQPQNASVSDGTFAHFLAEGSVLCVPVNHQWQRYNTGTATWDNLSGETNPTLSFIAHRNTDNGAQFRSLVSLFGYGVRTSLVATLTVTPDATPPTLVSAAGSADGHSVLVRFSKLMDPTSIAAGDFTLNNGGSILSASLLADGLTAFVNTSFQLPGQVFTITVTGARDATENHNVILAGSSLTYTNPIYVPGAVRVRRYDGISGTAVSDLTGNALFPNFPTVDIFQDNMHSSPNLDNYGLYMTGYLVPPQSGNYNIYVASDDNSEAWLSSDATPANKRLIASVVGWTNDREYTKYPSQKSPTLSLLAGVPYYIEAYQKEGGGGDHLTVAYQFNGGAINDIAGSMIGQLSPPDPATTVSFVSEPASVAVNAGATVALAASAFSVPDKGLIRYQWQKNGANIPNAINTTYTTPPLSVFDSGSQYRVIAVVPGGVAISTNAVITVNKAESVPPQIAKVQTVDGRKVGVVFSEAVMGFSVLNSAAYTVTPVGGVKLTPVTGTGDVVVGFPATFGDPPQAAFSAPEGPASAVDGILRTKYLNFGMTNAGFTVTLGGGAKAIKAVRVTTANDAPERDPASMILEGSVNGTTFVVITNTALPTNQVRGYQNTVPIADPTAYLAYRVTFPTIADSTLANSMQVAEVELLGQPAAVHVTGVTLSADQTVAELTLSAGLQGAFQVSVANLTDTSANTNVLATASGTARPFEIMDTSAMANGDPNDPNPPYSFDYANMVDGFENINVGGSDIWNNQDGLNFIYQEITGDFDVSARIDSLFQSDYWAKCGVMAREGLAAPSRHYTVAATPPSANAGAAANRIQAVTRYTYNNASTSYDHFPTTNNGNDPLPYPNVWVRLVRQGGTFHALDSLDGVTWTEFRSDPDTFPPRIWVGIATTSHSPGNLTHAVVSEYTIKPAVLPPGQSNIVLNAVAAGGNLSTNLPGSGTGRTLNLLQGAQNGNATLVGGLLTYTANPGFNGTDHLVYVVTDANGTSIPINVYIPVGAFLPMLTIQPAPGAVVLRWPAQSSIGFQLMSKPDLTRTNWNPVTNVPAPLGSDLILTIPATDPMEFYQLQR
jgi:hypothetical protein